jgi:hypothetical protein
MIWLLFIFLFFHFLADYPLQGDFLSKAKNRNSSIGKVFWKHALFAHSFIHAGFVGIVTALATGSQNIGLIFAAVELIAHGFTDFLKCENKITLNTDQAIHFACKIIYAALIAFAV